jgi:ABC-2 type transport system ATP-binding protein
LIILDEPTTGLDPAQRDEFLQRILTLAKHHGKTILLSTHILHDVRQVCDHVVILVKGQVRVEDTLENLSRPIESGVVVRFLHELSGAEARFQQHGIAVQQIAMNAVRVVGGHQEDIRGLWTAASSMGAMVQSIEPIRRSLEEIFIEAVGEAGSGNS